MGSDFREKLAAAIGVEAPKICEVQKLYHAHKKYLSNRVIAAPLPQKVHLRDENFPYWIKLENPDPSRLGEWVGAKANIVVPLLEAGIFDQKDRRFDEARGKALLSIPELLRNPNCIHENRRHA